MKQNSEDFENCCADIEAKSNWGIRACKRNRIGLINLQDPRIGEFMASSKLSTSLKVKQLKTIIPRERYEIKWLQWKYTCVIIEKKLVLAWRQNHL